MKAFQKFVQLSFIVVVLMTMMGFRMSIEKCAGSNHATISFFAGADCCCEKSQSKAAAKKSSCKDMVCFTQTSAPYVQEQTKDSTQVNKAVKEKVTRQSFERIIRPELLAVTPHFNLPPPPSGRFIGILHQQFII